MSGGKVKQNTVVDKSYTCTAWFLDSTVSNTKCILSNDMYIISNSYTEKKKYAND